MIEITEYLAQGATTSGASGTERIDLPEAEQISMIMLELRVQNASGVIDNERTIFDAITSIEVVAGGKTLFSLEPEPAAAAAFYTQNGKLPRATLWHGKTKTQVLYLPLFFGRFRGDEQYLLDTARYKNPQLVISWALDTSPEVSGSFVYTISYQRPLDKVSGVLGFVRWREIKKETSGASVQTIRHDLPTDFPWHYLAVRVEDVDQNIRTDLDGILLNIDSGRLRLIDVDVDELHALDQIRYPDPNSYFQMYSNAAALTVRTCGDGNLPKGYAVDWLAHRNPVFTSVVGEQMLCTVYGDASGTASDDTDVAVDIRTANPHGCLTLFDGRKGAFPIPDYGQAWIDYTQAAYVVIYDTFVAELVAGGL